MSTQEQTQVPSESKVVSVEPAPIGPIIKPKRQLTEAQLLALKKGRERLAEKRRQQQEEKSLPAEDQEEVKEESDEPNHEAETQTEEEDGGWFCTIM